MSFKAGLTSSSQNLAYSKVSPADFENSTTATSGATSKTSAVTESFPFLPSDAPCNLIWKSFTFATLLNPFATISSFAMIALAVHLDVNMEPVFLLLSNKLERSKPDDIDDMNSNALKNLGDDGAVFSSLLLLFRSSSKTGDGGGSWVENRTGLENPL
ncbi:LOW QUALITY PROTEIN: hypothetical protein TorRG33x02_050810 [Trema orientale]|uniref:Uncharacterized protein n=1 Tax=Trema orientale TaxID=63057 RepID=A0A2P5FN37_TREOI|nr:LOW QUALITY PROTEIN: hypothetical protein TorRG33x02_050810 [Trema orientale]